MTQPDFETFFAGEFQRRLEQTIVPDMTDASWDRRAAYLVWRAERRGTVEMPYPTPHIIESQRVLSPQLASVFE